MKKSKLSISNVAHIVSSHFLQQPCVSLSYFLCIRVKKMILYRLSKFFFVGHCRSELANTFINCGNGHRCENSLQHAFSHIPTALDDTLCLKIAANTFCLGTRITFTSTHPTNTSFFELLNVFHPLAVCDVM